MIAAFDIGSTTLKYTAGKTDETLETEIYSEKTDAKNLSAQISSKVKNWKKRQKTRSIP
ncbi:MAG: hypothetical protein ABEJ87_00985 [Candidatus Nanohalobium sp.]